MNNIGMIPWQDRPCGFPLGKPRGLWELSLPLLLLLLPPTTNKNTDKSNNPTETGYSVFLPLKLATSQKPWCSLSLSSGGAEAWPYRHVGLCGVAGAGVCSHSRQAALEGGGGRRGGGGFGVVKDMDEVMKSEEERCSFLDCTVLVHASL